MDVGILILIPILLIGDYGILVCCAIRPLGIRIGSRC